MSRNRYPGKHTTYTGRVVYVRKRHFFTQADITRILYRMHDNDHYDIFWEIFSLLLLEFRIIMDSLEIAEDVRKFLKLFFSRVWDLFIFPFLGRAAATMWDLLGLLGIQQPNSDI